MTGIWETIKSILEWQLGPGLVLTAWLFGFILVAALCALRSTLDRHR